MKIVQSIKIVLPHLFKTPMSCFITLSTLCLIIIEGLCVGYPAVFFAKLSNALLEQSSHPHIIYYYLSGLLGAMGIRWLFPKIQTLIFFYVVNEAIQDIRLNLIMHWHAMGIADKATYAPTEVLGILVRISMAVRGLLHAGYIMVFPACFKLIFLLIALHTEYKIFMYIPIIIFSMLYLLIAMRQLMILRKHGWDTSDKVLVHMRESLVCSTMVQFNIEKEKHMLQQTLKKERIKWWDIHIQEQSIAIIQGVLFFIGFSYSLYEATNLLLANKITYSDFIEIHGYLILIYPLLSQIRIHILGTLKHLIDFRKAVAIFSTPILNTNNITDNTILCLKQPIFSCSNLTFKYPEQNHPALINCNLQIKQGEHIAIMGTHGSGKSTLCNLLAGIYKPTYGQVSYQQKSLTKITSQDLGDILYFIPQGSDYILESRYITQPDNTHIIADEGNNKISGGELQKLLLKQCIIRKPKVAILDEACSALDKSTALKLLHQICQIVPTVIFVTHREELLQDFTKQYILENGKIYNAPRNTKCKSTNKQMHLNYSIHNNTS